MTSLTYTKRTQQYLDETVEELEHIQHGPENALKYLASKLGVKAPAVEDLSASLTNLTLKTPVKTETAYDPNEVVLVDELPKSPMPACVSPQNDPRRKANASFDLKGLNFTGHEKSSGLWATPMNAKMVYPHDFNPDTDLLKAHYKDGKPYLNHDGFENWYMSQKIDGMRGMWDGKRMISKSGKIIKLPKFFTKDFPKKLALDGELKLLDLEAYPDTGGFPGVPVAESNGFFTKGIKGKVDETDERWLQARYCVFDIPSSTHPFSQNIKMLMEVAKGSDKIFYLTQTLVEDKNIIDTMDDVIKAGGEGLVLRRDSRYDHCNGEKRTKDAVKVKPKYESEGTIIKLLRTPSGMASYRINNLKGDLYNGCDPSKMIRVSHSVPKGLKVGDVITFTYLNVSPKSMNAKSAVFLRLRNEED